MRVIPTHLSDVLLIEPQAHRDKRGCFAETYHAQRYQAHGIAPVFVQDNFSRSIRNTLRGLHAQRRKPQAKLIRVVEGEIFDVAVDIRPGSQSFGQWVGVLLSAESLRQLFVPVGFAHGFCVVSDVAQVEYKCSAFYDPEDELSIRWDDPAIAINWPVAEPLLSEKDRHAPMLSELLDRLPVHLARAE